MHRRLATAYLATICLTTAEGYVQTLMAPYMDYLGYPAAMVGLLVSVFSLVALCSRFPAGLLYGPSRVWWLMGGALLAMIGSSLLYPTATEPLTLGLVRALNGAGFGVASTLILALFMDALPPGEPTQHPMGLFGAAMAGGFAFGMAVGGTVADLLGYAFAFRAGALLPLATAALLLDVIPKVRWRSRGGSAKRPALPWRARLRAVARGLAYPEVVAVCLSSFLLNVQLQVGMTFFALYGLAIGLSLTEVSLVRSAHSLVQVFGRLFTGELSVRFGHRRLMSGSLALLCLAYMLIPLFQNVVALTLVFLVIGTLRAIGLVATTICMAEDIPEEKLSRGVSASVYNSAKDVGNIAGPLLGGAVAAAVGVQGVFLAVPGLALALHLLVQQLARRAATASAAAVSPES